jgi:hypothetical protein
MMDVVDVGLAASFEHRRAALQDQLGAGFAVGDRVGGPGGVVVLDESLADGVRDLRAASPGLGIIVLLGEGDDCTPRAVVALVDAGADVCLVAPGTAGLAAHVRALAAHHPARGAPATAPRACVG